MCVGLVFSFPELDGQAPDLPQGVASSGYYHRVLQQLVQIAG